MTEKLAKSFVGSYDIFDIGPDSATNRLYLGKEPDKLGIPKKWHDLVSTIRFYYERDPIVSSVINKSVDIGINDISNNQGESDDTTFKVFENFEDDLLMFLKDMAREYLLSGLLIPEITWGSKDVDGSVYTLPTSMWLRDPATIVAKITPIPNRIIYKVTIDDETIEFIQANGRYSDGTVDKDTYNLLVAKYPDFVRAVKKGETEFPLTDPFIIIRRSPLSGKAYPTPFLMGVIESLSHKRNMRKMDYSIAARVISAIQVITLGNNDYPLTEGDEDQLNDLKAQMRWRGRTDNIERVFQLFGNHTLQISWVYPDTQAMLNDAKYASVNQDIMFGLGFPRILLNGETLRSASSNAEFAMFSPSETIKSMRKDLEIFVKKLYSEIARLNGFDTYPDFAFEPLRLYDVEKMSQAAKDLYEKGVLSRTTYLEISGHDFDTEINNIAREREILAQNNVPEYAPQPFTPQPGVPGQQQQPPQQPQQQNDNTNTQAGVFSRIFNNSKEE